MTSVGTAVRRLALFAVCLLVIGSPIGAAEATPYIRGIASAQGQLPALTAPVNDFASVIDAASAAELDRIIRVLQTTTGDVVVVATIDSFAPYATIEEYATRLFEQAGIGTRKADSGVLMLVAVRDRRVRIEVGYGIEEFITDGFAGDTIRTQMLPAFREGGYGPGLVAGVTRVITRIAQGRGVTLPNVAVAPRATSRPQADGGLSPGALVVMVLLFLLIGRFGGFGGLGGLAGVLLQNRRGRRSTWSGWHGGSGGFGGGFGGGGGGGFGGFGGGRSGGGGASGGW